MTEQHSYETRGGIRVTCSIDAVDGAALLTELTAALDTQRGVLLASSYEYPGRYTRWDMGFVNPPLLFEARDRTVEVKALNERGRLLIAPIVAALAIIPSDKSNPAQFATRLLDAAAAITAAAIPAPRSAASASTAAKPS